jgi:protein ImuB
MGRMMKVGAPPARRVACVWVPAFEAAAAERGEPALADRPLAIVRGTAPATRVSDANAAARERGVRAGMTEAQARARCPALVTRPASAERLAAARHALLEAMLAVSPRLEDGGPGLVDVDVSGLGRLVGDDAAVGERLMRQARRAGMSARVAVADRRAAARLLARALPDAGRVVVVPPGGERAALAPVPLAVLDLPEDVAAVLASWGVRTLGALAALPRAGLATRLGAAGLRAHDLAQGIDPAPFQPWTPPPFWEEAQGLDWEITDRAALVALLGEVLGRLAARLAVAHLAADLLDVQLGLASGGCHQRTIALAHPTHDLPAMLGLLRLDLEAHPPPAPVTRVALSVRPVRARPGQGGLWQPPMPAHRDLTALLARLVDLAGADRVGTPVLDDTHRPDAFTLAPFRPPADDAGAPGRDRPRPACPAGHVGREAAGVIEQAGEREHALALRRLRPPCPVAVVTAGDRPARVTWRDAVLDVRACAGPWRRSGEWWDTRAWARDEWDVLLADGVLCRLVLDRASAAWTLEGVYD